MKKSIIATIVAAAVAIAALVVFMRCRQNGCEVSGPVGTGAAAAGENSAREGVRPGGKARPARVRRRPKPVLDLSSVGEDDEDEFTPEERLLADRIEKALDEESLDDAIACADEALKCANAEIRQSMVDTLGWFGSQALPELTPFLADADEDVRDSAMNEWSMAVSLIENEEEKIRTVELAMQVLDDEDALEEISGEYIGIDERLAVESIIRIVSADRSAQGTAKAKETYEFVTGDEWTDVEEAERWIAEDYEPPESEEPPEDGYYAEPEDEEREAE